MTTETLIDGLCFGEGPRWRDGRLYFSDMHASTVYALDEQGHLETIVKLEDDEPSGLGWLPDGRMLIVSMQKRKLLAFDGTSLEDFADLSEYATYHCNDMVTDAQGRSYVGNFGFDLHHDGEFCKAAMVLVHPDGSTELAADELSFPNGTVITPDGKTLIVGESFGARLTAFDIGEDGRLSNRREWAPMEGAVPDGICLDEADGIWVASPVSNEALRVIEGGEVTDRVQIKNQAFACMLGGEDGKTLFIMTSGSSHPDKSKEEKSAAVETVRVEHAGAGLP
ncbi:MAG: SMP-30/gluconolactonase/LRE family protein [Pseudomonadales bacterium]|nr:SMP-30/gluconolactonase/LRE family protein [Pseudomonadales bacterium]MBO6563938.1 SMP-30/gluconolactonase/LRE family protein [Pseudomonadales bacterium]MBO6595943.1 SMP-30/gluconolactonase/LRE family protein [Pseudomonadales bacterium]MBO6656809.1 SMP-30/gluconolactonase/LRE family protein [Pseudomonadales bacterium]MBO6822426.1 SMP-30/gluconolactonase/LRE family protein [Pseudomonadales bacterium]